MSDARKPARINVRLIVTIVLAVGVLGVGAFTARKIRSSIIAKNALAEGKAAFERGDWEVAAKELREFLSRQPDNPDILAQYAHALLRREPIEAASIAGATDAYRRILRLVPGDENAYKWLARLYRATGNREEFIYIANQRLKELQDDPDATIWKAEALIMQKKTADAGELLNELERRLRPRASERPQYNEACALLASLEVDDVGRIRINAAIERLTAGIDNGPPSARLLVHRANLYGQRAQDTARGLAQREQDLGAARADLELAATLPAGKPSDRLVLAAEWLALNDTERASAALEMADAEDIEAVHGEFLDPDDWEAAKFQQRAELLIRAQERDEGAALAERVLRPDEPSKAILTQNRHRLAAIPAAVRLFLASGTDEGTRRAKMCLDEHRLLAPLFEQATGAGAQGAVLNACVACSENRPYGVVQLLEPLTVSGLPRAQSATVWEMLAAAYHATNQTRREIVALEEYRKILPGDAGAVMQLVRAHIRQGAWGAAIDAARLVDPKSDREIELRLLRMQATVQHVSTRALPASDEAIARLESEILELRQARPRDVEVRQLLAALAVYRERDDQAEDELKRAIEECDQTLPAELQLARLYLRQGRADDAIGVCRKACERHPNRAQPLDALAQALRRAGQNDEAHETMLSGLESLDEPTEKRSLALALARFEIAYGDLSAGIDRLKAMAKADPNDVHVRDLLLALPKVRDAPDGSGQILIDELKQVEGERGLLWRSHQAAMLLSKPGWRGHTDEIKSLLEYCLRSDPGSPPAALMLGAMYERLNDRNQAEAVYRRVLTLNPGAAGVAERLLDLLEREERFVEAREVLAQLEPNDPAAASRRIRLALRSGEFQEAVSELELRVAADPNDGESRVLLARLLYADRRDAESALKLLDEAEPHIENPLPVVAARAAILLAEDRTQEAERLLDDLIARENTVEAHFLRAQYFAAIERHDRAEADYRNAAKLSDNSGGYGMLGFYYFQNDRLPDAIDAWQRGLELYHDDPTLERLLMKALLGRNQGDDRAKAEALLNKLTSQLAEGEEDPDLMAVRAGLLLERSGSPDDVVQARDLLERVVALQPSHRGAHLSLIGLAFNRGDFEAMRELAIRALGRNPDDAALMIARAEAERRLNNRALALRLTQMVLDDDPANSDACNLLVTLALQSGEPQTLENALTFVERQLQEAPAHEGFQVSRALLLAELKEIERAASLLGSFAEAHPESCGAPTFLVLAELRLLLGNRADANAAYLRAFERSPNDHGIFLQRVRWLAAQKPARTDRMIALVDAFIQRFPESIDLPILAANLVAYSATQAGATEVPLQNARSWMEHVRRVSPDSAEAALLLGHLAYSSGDLSLARDFYRQALALDPNNAAALNDLAWCTLETASSIADYEEALKLADRGVSLAPADPHLRDTRGEILARLPGRLRDAKADFQKRLELVAGDEVARAKTLLKLGRVCLDLGDIDASRRNIDEAVRIDRRPNGAFDDEDRKLLAELRDRLRGAVTSGK